MAETLLNRFVDHLVNGGGSCQYRAEGQLSIAELCLPVIAAIAEFSIAEIEERGKFARICPPTLNSFSVFSYAFGSFEVNANQTVAVTEANPVRSAC